MVTFGARLTFVIVNRPLRKPPGLKPRGWFACMWNHRELENPIQSKIESIIKERVSGYGYGTRREDQTEVINSCAFSARLFILTLV